MPNTKRENDLTFKSLLKLSNKNYVTLIRSLAPSLFFLWLIVFLIKWFYKWIEFRSITMGVGFSSHQILFTLSSGLLDLLVFSVVIFLIPLYLYKKQHPEVHITPSQLAKKTLFTLSVEGFRSFFYFNLYFLLFVIPGIIKYLQYSFVSFVVFFDTDYEKAQTDALTRSSELTKGHLWVILFIVFFEQILNLTINMGLRATLGQSLLEQGLMCAASSAFTILISCYTFTLLFLLYSKKSAALKEIINEPNI